MQSYKINAINDNRLISNSWNKKSEGKKQDGKYILIRKRMRKLPALASSTGVGL
jgi:hypothetical protein